MNWKGFGRKLSFPKQGTILAFARRIEENMKNLSQDIWWPG
jgi:hypothetical protein